MRVGLVVYGSLDTVSGGYLYDRKLAAHLRSAGDDVEIISLKPGGYTAHLLDNFSFRLPDSRSAGPCFDVIILDELVHPSVLSAVSRVRSAPNRYPVISLVHNLRSSEKRPAWQNGLYALIEKQHLVSVDGFIFNSDITHASVRRLIGNSKPFVIAPPGGDRLGTLGLQEVLRRARAEGPLRILFLANISPLKGLHVILDALQGLPSESYWLEVVGSPAVDRGYARRMQEQARGLPVHFRGILDGEDLIKVFKRADVMVLPSYYEGFGISFLEGMAFGLPAIGTRAGAIPSLITHGENGFLIDPGDFASLADHVRRLHSDRQLLARMSEAALSRFAISTTWSESAQAARGFLIEMAARSRSARL